jgi:hypothetical protein
MIMTTGANSTLVFMMATLVALMTQGRGGARVRGNVPKSNMDIVGQGGEQRMNMGVRALFPLHK